MLTAGEAVDALSFWSVLRRARDTRLTVSPSSSVRIGTGQPEDRGQQASRQAEEEADGQEAIHPPRCVDGNKVSVLGGGREREREG